MTFSLDELAFGNSSYFLSGPERDYFFYCDNNGKWLWREKNSAGWVEHGELPRQGTQLCAVLDRQGSPHLVIYEKGIFFHLMAEQDLFTESEFYLEDSKICSHFLLGCDADNHMHLLYLALDSKDSRWWLLHHRRTARGWEEPRVIDFGGGNAVNYGDIAIDSKNTLHLLYRIKEHEQTSLYYRHFNPVAQSWSKALPLATGSEISFPAITVDGEQNIHTLWSSGDQSGYRLHYRAMIKGGWPTGGWKPAAAISPVLEHRVFPFFGLHGQDLIMAWLDHNNVTFFRYRKHSWEKAAPLVIEGAQPVRHCSAAAPGGLFPLWILAKDGVPLPLEPDPAVDTGPTENLEPQFYRLQQVSEALVNRASSLSMAKSRLEQALEEKRREMTWISQQNKRNLQALQQSLKEKDSELQQLEEKFKATITELKQKMEQTRKKWDEERKRYLNDLLEHKKERRQFDLMLKEKENTIARLNLRIREQEQVIKQLSAENEAITEQLNQKSWNFKKLLEKILHNKP